MVYLPAGIWTRSLAGFIIASTLWAGATQGAVAAARQGGRSDLQPSPVAPTRQILRCPPKIIAKCRQGKKPVCVALEGKCCARFECRPKPPASGR
jgi:hypothetical protein